jgi:hypothetical protein
MLIGDKYLGGKNPYTKLTEFHASLECEVEAIRNGGEHFGNWKCIQDHSLRNNGFEYVCMIPRTIDHLMKDFISLHSHLDLKKDADPFSERTSTHVHVNVTNLDEEHVKNMVLLYALFEEFFFSMVKPSRRDNIHCVPLTETYLPDIYSKSLDAYITKWSKYTALNLKRITDIGTVEFRHMHGTNDVGELRQWLEVLENLWKLCTRVSINEKSLANKAEIQDWFDLLFHPAPKIMMLKPSLFDIIRNSLIDVKMSTVSSPVIVA